MLKCLKLIQYDPAGYPRAMRRQIRGSQGSRSLAPLLRKMALFAFAPAISMLAPLVAMPAISSTFGAAGWSSIATGQSLGMAVAVVVELGWGITGPIRAASASTTEISKLYRQSLRERGVVLLGFTPVMIAVVLALNTMHPFVAILSAISMSLNGLAASWLYVGMSRPLSMIALDTLPRAGASLVGAGILFLDGRTLEILPAVQIIGGLAATVAPFFFLPAPTPRNYASGSVRTTLRDFWNTQGAALVLRLSTTAYVALPTVLLAVVSGPAGVATYAAIDRLARAVLSGLGSAGQAFQGWIPAVSGRDRLSRIRTALYFNLGLAVVSGFTFAAAAPWLLKVLFLERVNVTNVEIISFAAAIALIVMSRCTGIQCLAVLGKTWSVAASTSAAFFVAIPSILITGHHWGASGVAVTIACLEGLVLVVQLVSLLLAVRAERKMLTVRADVGQDVVA